jgi:hypothetical protein
MAAMLHIRTFYVGEYDLFFYSFIVLTIVKYTTIKLSTNLIAL